MTHIHKTGGHADVGQFYGSDEGRFDLLSDTYPQTGRHVLLIQHNGIELGVMKAMLSALGYHVTTANEVDHAIDYFDQMRPNVIISEFDMPVLGGFQLAQRMKIHAPETRIIMLTARCQAEVVGYINSRVVDGWLFKPFRLQTLDAMLQKLVFPDMYSEC